MDWKLPGMDGMQALEHLRQSQGEDQQLTVIMTTAYDLAEFRAHPVSRLADAVLGKPISASTLLSAVTRVMAIRDRERVQAREHSSDTAGLRRLEGLRVLVADDNEINRVMTRKLLKLEGAEVVLAENGKVALERLRASTGPFSAVLMDVQMPVLDGIEATREIRRDSRYAKLPILAPTAGALASEHARSSGTR